MFQLAYIIIMFYTFQHLQNKFSSQSPLGCSLDLVYLIFKSIFSYRFISIKLKKFELNDSVFQFKWIGSVEIFSYFEFYIEFSLDLLKLKKTEPTKLSNKWFKSVLTDFFQRSVTFCPCNFWRGDQQLPPFWNLKFNRKIYVQFLFTLEN